MTTAGLFSALSLLETETHARFDAQVDRMQAGLERRFGIAEQLLTATRAAFLAASGLSPGQFREFVLRGEFERFFPGVLGVGQIDMGAQDSGVPGGPVPLRISRYAETTPGIAGAMGLAPLSDPPQLQAARQALQTGRVTLSAPVSLGPQGALRAWLMMAPGTGTDGAAGRLFFIALDMRQILDILRDTVGGGVHFQLWDGEDPQRGELLYDSRGTEPAGALPASRFSREDRLMLGDRMLVLRVAGSPSLGRNIPWVVIIGGGLLSALLALAAWLLMSGRDRARNMAAEMTADLQRMARVVERTTSAMFGMDLDGRITWANVGFERLTGLAADECIGRQATELPEIAGLDPASRQLLGAAIARREARRFELLNQMREGVRYWTDTELQPTRDSDGQISGFICIATDITRRKLAELRLRDSEHLMRVIADNLPARVSYWDRDRRCRFVNRRFCEVFGRSPEQLQLQPLSPEIFGQAFYDWLEPHVEKVLAGEPQYFEYQGDAGDGRRSAWQLHYIPDAEDGEVRGFFVLALDVTELRQARDLAVQASQSKSRFLSSMSHEIRTPLNAVMGMLALLRGTELNARQCDYAEKADRAARSLLSLLNDILDLAKIEAGKMTVAPRAFALDELLRDLSVIFAASVGRKELEVLFEVDPQLPARLVADDLRLRQVLINLGSNAIKFTECGSVALGLRLLERLDGAVRLEVSVRDTGIGIAPQEQERIFSEFGQASDSTARDFGGTGLGLGICQKLLGLMGSQLRLDSQAGRGSRFWFELVLPVAADAPAVAAPAPVGHRKVLIVDDNADARESLAAMAHSLGWTADLAAGGEEALAIMAGAPAHGGYDAVFIDWRMPDMDGWQASLRIRRLPAGAQPPLVIMVTAHGRDMLGERPPAEQALLDGFLVKPVTASMLLEVLQASEGRGREAAPPLAQAPSRPLAGMRLLLVEDNPTNQQVAMELLAARGAEVDVACDGREGVERIRAGADRYDAVLMDVLMPVMDGYAATRAVRGQLGNWRLPIIAMTANAMESDRMESLAAGMNDHIGKPFAIDDLVQVLLRHTREARKGGGEPGPVAGAQDAGRGATDTRPPSAPGAGAAPAGPARASESLATDILDRVAAVQRLGGDNALYERLVPSFSESLAGIAARLPTLLHSVPQPEAVRLMHTLKGSAATMGAAQLSAAAAAAERALARPQSQPGDAEVLNQVSQAIEQTLAALPQPR